jgi:hypothetical protein
VAKSDWMQSVKKSELLELDTKEEFAALAHLKHLDILGVAEYKSHKHLSTCVAQDNERFSTKKEDDDSKCCWTCGVTVKCLEKSLCSGCHRARYCSMECLKGDWSVHGDWCQMRRRRREEKEVRKMRKKMIERARKDIEADNFVD